MLGRFVVVFVVASLGLLLACSSSSGGSGASSGCASFCNHLQGGQSCAGLDVGDCIAECEGTVVTCPARADALLACLSQLPFSCLGPGQTVGHPNGAPAPASVYLSTGTSTVEIQDAECAELATAFTECSPVGSGGNGGSGGSAFGGAGGGGTGGGGGSAGVDAGSGGSGGGSGGSVGGSGGSVGGSGGSTGNCDPSHPYYCAATNTCWQNEPDCDSVTSCAGDWVACTPTQSAKSFAVDCTLKKCVATSASCDASYPVFCPAKDGAVPACYTAGAQCSTVVYCDGIGAKVCSQANQAVDCANNLCLTPKVGESSNAACSNGIDDDGNGYIDCTDFHCLANPSVTVCSSEADDLSCSNGLDDDGNGFSDCKDFTCQISPAVTKCASERTDAACHDGIDNDGDAKTDCADPSCYGSPFTICP